MHISYTVPGINIRFCFPMLFLVLQKVLATHGAAKVSAYVTHGVFPKRSWERFTHKDGKHLNLFLSLTFSFEPVPFLIDFFGFNCRRLGKGLCLLLDNRFLPPYCQSHSK
jgi:hypothetical protein